MRATRTKTVRSHPDDPENEDLGTLLRRPPHVWSDVKEWSGKLARALKRTVIKNLKELSVSFLGLHFVWSVLNSIILSVIVYPKKNMSYTDALFQSVSAVTNTGLNSVDLGKINFYQQLFIFISQASTHPLMVNEFLCLYRLWLFKRQFDNIDDTARFQSKLRRTATMARVQNREAGGPREAPDITPFQLNRESPPVSIHNPQYDNNGEDDGILVSGHHYHGANGSSHFGQTPEKETPEPSSANDSSGSSATKTADDSANNHDNHYAEDSDKHSAENSAEPSPGHSAEHLAESTEQSQTSTEEPRAISSPPPPAADAGEQHHRDIKFGSLPVPPSREHHPNPQDMYRSLNMMQTQRQQDDEDEGPALVIKSPRDIEEDAANGVDSPVYAPRRRRESQMTGGSDIREMGRNDTYRSGWSNPWTSDNNNELASKRSKAMTSNYLSWTPTIARNSAFVGLTEEQKEELGGVEYSALKVLRWVIPAYFLICVSISTVMLVPWCYKREKYRNLIRESGQNPGWFAFTVCLSAFFNNGLNLLGNTFPDFHETAYFPVIVGLTIMLGNVFLPLMLRGMLWLMFCVSPQFGRLHESLGFLLDHPRRCTMLYLPAKATFQLTAVFLGFMVAEVSMFMILNEGAHDPYPYISAGGRLLCAFFQSASIRSAGFAIISIGSQHPSMLLFNIASMYTSVYPMAMAIRKTNVYEEQTLGIYYHEDKNEALKEEDEAGASPLVSHIRRQLSIDMMGVLLALGVTSITEGSRITRGDFSLFDMIYEVISGYGSVGMSIGYKDTDLSLSGGFSTLGKVTMIFIMIRGLHRGLPYRLDRAILMKGSEVENRDDIQQERARHPTVYQQPTPSEGTPWMNRVNTTASRLRSVASNGFPRTLTRRSTARSRRSDTRPAEEA